MQDLTPPTSTDVVVFEPFDLTQCSLQTLTRICILVILNIGRERSKSLSTDKDRRLISLTKTP